MRHYLSSSFKMVGVLAMSWLLAIFMVPANGQANAGSGKITVTASVAPARYIVVDSDNEIIQIFSNTPNEVSPTVVLNTTSGRRLKYSESIQYEYTKLKPNLNFSRPGEVYKRQIPPVINVINSATGFLD